MLGAYELIFIEGEIDGKKAEPGTVIDQFYSKIKEEDVYVKIAELNDIAARKGLEVDKELLEKLSEYDNESDTVKKRKYNALKRESNKLDVISKMLAIVLHRPDLIFTKATLSGEHIAEVTLNNLYTLWEIDENTIKLKKDSVADYAREIIRLIPDDKEEDVMDKYNKKTKSIKDKTWRTIK